MMHDLHTYKHTSKCQQSTIIAHLRQFLVRIAVTLAFFTVIYPYDTTNTPVVEEKRSISKESVASNTVIEKRWITRTELVRVPVTYEEIYVNGKPISGGAGGILSGLKKALSGKNETEKKSEDKEPKGEFVPISTKEEEKLIPMFGEKIIIT
ncbi:MAG: hypothetical protein ACJ71B_13175, partial [Nitrososphaera sp.]